MLLKRSRFALLAWVLLVPVLGCGGSPSATPPSKADAAKTPPLTLPTENGTLTNTAPP